MAEQLSLFQHVLASYVDAEVALDNDALYADVAKRARIPAAALTDTHPVGKDRQPRNLITRANRWHQQTLKAMGIVHHIENARGVWELTQPSRSGLREATTNQSLVAFSTKQSHVCADTKTFHAVANQLSVAPHGATMPTALPEFLIQWLSQEYDLVVDLFAGWCKTGLAAERLNRRWFACERVLDYLVTARSVFEQEFPAA